MQSNRVAGKRIRIHRINLGESPEVFGSRIGVSGMTVRRIENGKPLTVRTAFLIAEDMHVPVVELWPPPSRKQTTA